MKHVDTSSEFNIPLEVEMIEDDWTFLRSNTRELTHCYHDYPARMIPQIASKLLDLYGSNASILFDPYCGTGTSLVEGVLRGIRGVGTDLNPLARLIAQSKIALPNLMELEVLISRFEIHGKSWVPKKTDLITEIDGISNLAFWFKPTVIQKLNFIRHFIDEIEDDEIKLFFQVAFSETVRESSNTRTTEFKLYRYDEKTLALHEPDVFSLMCRKLKRNYHGYRQYYEIILNNDLNPRAEVYGFNSIVGIPNNVLPQESVDIVVTSPPYGDSHTTVAYGQYSRLSAAWLKLPSANEIDRNLMGGSIRNAIPVFPSSTLNDTLRSIYSIDKKRAIEVASFYYDLSASITNVAKVIRTNGYACYVVGNRRVKAHTLPTSESIRSFFEQNGFEYITTHIRDIPNKRMPTRNSPTNQVGKLDATMTSELIVVMRKQ